jgi:hypothetical protein
VQWRGQLAVATPEEIDLSNAPAVQEGLLSVLSQRPAALLNASTTASRHPEPECVSGFLRAFVAQRRCGSAGSN